MYVSMRAALTATSALFFDDTLCSGAGIVRPCLRRKALRSLQSACMALVSIVLSISIIHSDTPSSASSILRSSCRESVRRMPPIVVTASDMSCRADVTEGLHCCENASIGHHATFLRRRLSRCRAPTSEARVSLRDVIRTERSC
jgi:hypothetical protein